MVTFDSTPGPAALGRGEFEELNLVRLWRIAVARRWLIAVVSVVVTVVATASTYLIDPIYRADVLLAGAEASEGDSPLGELMGQYGSLTNLAGINLGGKSAQSLNESTEILRSRAFTDQFITRYELLPFLFPESWDQGRKSWTDQGQDAAEPPTLWQAYKKLNSSRNVAKDSRTGFVKLSIEWPNPQLAASWANDMVAMLNEHLRKRAIDEAERSIEYLQSQLDLTSVVDRRQMLIGLMENETRKIVLAKARIEYAVRVLDPAVSPEEKVRPRRAIIAIASLLVGLIGGFLLAIVLQSLKPGNGL